MDEHEVIERAGRLLVSEELAEGAVPQAEGEPLEAGDEGYSMQPKYLYVKAKYILNETDGICGLIFLCVEKDTHGFSFVRTIAERDVDWVNSINLSGSPETFFRIFNEHAKNPRQGSIIYEAKKTAEDLSIQLKASLFLGFFKSWKESVTESSDTESQDDINPDSYETGTDLIAATLEKTVRSALEEVFLKRLEYFEVDYNFLTAAHHDSMLENLGIRKVMRSTSTGISATTNTTDASFKLYLKGSLIIDPAFGIRVQDLEVGDYVYCDILDRSEVVLSAARMIGAYRRGLWLPVRGRITEIEEREDERYRFRLQLSRSVYLDALSFMNLRVRQDDFTSGKRQHQKPETATPTNSLALLVAVILVAMLVTVFILMR